MGLGILDADGRPLDAYERAMARLETVVAESIFGMSADDRVRMLRESVLRERQQRATIAGLAAWSPPEGQ